MHKGEFSFPILGLLVLIGLSRSVSHPLRMSVAPDIHLGKGTHISHPGHLHGEVPEKVHNLEGLVSDTEHEDDRSDDGTKELLHKVHLHRLRINDKKNVKFFTCSNRFKCVKVLTTFISDPFNRDVSSTS